LQSGQPNPPQDSITDGFLGFIVKAQILTIEEKRREKSEHKEIAAEQ